MPETFAPVSLINDSGQKLNAAYFNRLETNLETFDDRIAANEVGVVVPLTVPYAATVTLDASLSGLFRITATGDLTLNDPINGQDGQMIVVEILASGADRTLILGVGSAVVIPSGQWWIGRLRYNATGVTWLLGDSDPGGGSSGSGGSTPTTPVTLTASSGVITPNATLGSLFRHTATTDVQLADPINGTDGQAVTVEVQASGADRTLSFAGSGAGSVVIPSGQWWSGELRYHTSGTLWALADGGSGSTGTSTGSTGTAPFINVIDQGATGNGTTDDTAAINTILSNAAAGSTIYFPGTATFKCTNTLNVTKRLTLTGRGTLNFTSGITNLPAVKVTADGCVLDGIKVVNPNSLGTNDTSGLAANVGIQIHCNEAIVTRCHVERWQLGIAVDPVGGEWQKFIITDNRVKDVLGAGAGPSDLTDTNGEDRGDGITMWGSVATITGNVVNAAPGTDCRVGVHFEGLSAYETVTTTPLNDRLVVISDNVVYGKFRRGIAVEEGNNSVVSGNVIADATWWGIAIVLGNDLTVTGNTVYWTRTSTDNQGQAWSPWRAPIYAMKASKNCVIANNTVRATSTSAAVAFVLLQLQSGVPTDFTINGNVCMADSGSAFTYGAFCESGASRPRFVNNSFVGFHDIGFYANGSQVTEVELRGNVFDGLTSPTNSQGINLSDDAHGRVRIVDNTIRNVVSAINRTAGSYALISGNDIANCANGIDCNTSTNTLVTGNIVSSTSNRIVNITNGASGNVVTNNITA